MRFMTNCSRLSPQTVAHALADSPAGQIAWSGQLFGNALSHDHIITNVAIYWLTNTAASAGRFYLRKQARRPPERADHRSHGPGPLRLRLPTDP